MTRSPAGAALALLLLAAALSPVSARGADHGYSTAVLEARSLVKEGMRGRSEAAPQAARVLEAGTGTSQAEVLRDLRRTPPDLVAADRRLAAVVAALDRPGSAGDAAGARRQVQGILAQPRYQSLRDGGSLWDRFWNWLVVNLLSWLLMVTFGSLAPWQWLVVLGAAGLASALVAAVIVRASRGGPKQVSEPHGPASDLRAQAADHFANADREALRGEYTLATRHLVAGVATAVSGRPFWETSPLTVRELLRESGRSEELRELLAVFEAARYGGRAVERDAYLRLDDLAAPYRHIPDQELAA